MLNGETALEVSRQEYLAAIEDIRTEVSDEKIRCPEPAIPRVFARGLIILLRRALAESERSQEQAKSRRDTVKDFVVSALKWFLAAAAGGAIVKFWP